MYFVRRFFELCKFLKLFTSLEFLYSAPCCVLQGWPPQPSCSLVPCEHTLLTAHKAALLCTVTSHCLCSDSRHLPHVAPSSPPMGFGTADQAALLHVPLLLCSSSGTPLGCPPPRTPGCPSCSSWALRPWAGCHRFAQTLPLDVRPHSFSLSLPSSFVATDAHASHSHPPACSDTPCLPTPARSVGL